MFEVTGNESVEELEALMEQFDDAELADDDDSESEQPAANVEQPSVDSETQSISDNVDKADSAPASEKDGGETEEGEKPEGVATKDGAHVIPFDVLERERREKQQLKEQIEALQKQQSEWEQSQRLLDVRNKQLEKLGVEPEDLPENFKISEEQLDTLAEDYPEIGQAIRGLFAKVEAVSQQSRSSPETKPAENDPASERDVVGEAIAKHPDLAKWSNEGGEQWKKAIEFDDKLRADPNWAEKSIDERFAEAARLTKEHFAESAKAKAAKAEADANNSLPPSPSETGSTTSHKGSILDKIANADESELYGLMSEMTEDQIEELLSQV
ncbi:hypothetical protein [Salinivibrio sp. YCSC6]|uniref:hypothetical protein n=1 Tax=Salinivibrio sp. YCSC6 TaxID=2003370 RepID=UPI000BBBE816|nr:hypothetical protein [Salinivibrio sp. YCSC6]PCE67537.1 hypothetical protein B6G00_04095 [Salinivibrio sp. YCSC6]QCF35556.1 hypothetical protein E8E00_04855 [Salinivibrio sp. YCSC6]